MNSSSASLTSTTFQYRTFSPRRYQNKTRTSPFPARMLIIPSNQHLGNGHREWKLCFLPRPNFMSSETAPSCIHSCHSRTHAPKKASNKIHYCQSSIFFVSSITKSQWITCQSHRAPIPHVNISKRSIPCNTQDRKQPHYVNIWLRFQCYLCRSNARQKK